MVLEAERRRERGSDSTWEYDIFLSHSSSDRAVAIDLQRRLRRFHWLFLLRPKIRVFRDETSLQSSSDLDDGLKQSIDRSRRLMVLCSRKMVEQSEWVPREVDHWLETRDDALDTIEFVTLDTARLTPDVVPTNLLAALEATGQPLGDRLVIDRSSGGSRREARRRLRLGLCRIAADVWNLPVEKTTRVDRRNRQVLTAVVLAALLTALVTLVSWQRARIENDAQLRLQVADEFDLSDRDFSAERFVGFGSLKNTFDRAAFTGAEFKETNFDGASLNRATFADAEFFDVRFGAVSAVDASFSCPTEDLRTDCRAASFHAVEFIGESRLVDVNFNFVHLDNVVFEGVDLHDSSFIGATGTVVVFHHVDLKGVNMTQARFEDVTFELVCMDEETELPPGVDKDSIPNLGHACRLGG